MSVRIPFSVLEAALKRVIVEQEATPAQPTKQEIFAKQLDQLNKANEGETIAAQDKKFVKRGGDWYIADVQLSQDALLSLVNDESYEDIEKKIRRGATSVTIKGEQFIGGGTQKAATFVKDRTGVWEDQTPVPPQIVAQYIVLPDESAPFEADVSGVGGEKQWVYKQDELMVVLTDQNMYVMASSGNTDDPLGATYNLLAKTGVLSNFMDVGSARKGFLGLGGKKTNAEQISAERASLKKFLTVGGLDETSPDFYNVPLSNLNMGDLTTAIARARTFGAKVFDLFTADNIKMNFTMTKFGPALVRSLVVGGRKGERGSGGLSDNDIRTLQATQLFREEALPNAGGGNYTVNLDLKTQNLVEASGAATPKPIKADLEVTPIGGANFNPGVKFVDAIDGGAAASGYSDAFLLYTKGIATKGVVVQQPEVAAPPPSAAAPPAPPSPTVNPDGTPVGDKDGAVFFPFNKSDSFDDTGNFRSGPYIDSVVSAINGALTNAVGNKKIDVTVIATADVKGKASSADSPGSGKPGTGNVALSGRRGDFLVAKLKEKLSDNNNKVTFTVMAAGEEPYSGMPDSLSEEKRKFQRFAKVYWGQLDLSQSVKIAAAFTSNVQAAAAAAAAAAPAASPANESREVREIRSHIRRILLESMKTRRLK